MSPTLQILKPSLLCSGLLRMMTKGKVLQVRWGQIVSGVFHASWLNPQIQNLQIWKDYCPCGTPNAFYSLLSYKLFFPCSFLPPPCQTGRLDLGLQQRSPSAWGYGWRDWHCRETAPQFTLCKSACRNALCSYGICVVGSCGKGHGSPTIQRGWHITVMIKDASLRIKQYLLCHLSRIMGGWKPPWGLEKPWGCLFLKFCIICLWLWALQPSTPCNTMTFGCHTESLTTLCIYLLCPSPCCMWLVGHSTDSKTSLQVYQYKILHFLVVWPHGNYLTFLNFSFFICSN